MEKDAVRSALQEQLVSSLRREISFAKDPPSIQECLEVLTGFGFSAEELKSASWQLTISHINRKVSQHGLRAEYLKGAYSVGVQGDARTYSPVVVLYGPFPGYEVLEDLGTRIPNDYDVNKVSYELAIRGTPLEEILTKEQLNKLHGES